jgi:thioredoxin-like negative regulator of GroEL
MGFWRQAIDWALDDQTRREIEEQRRWAEAEPANPRPYYQLAQLYRTQGRREEALGLLLEAVRQDERFAAAHVALAEMYAVVGDMPAARRHAERAAAEGEERARAMLERHSRPPH